MRANRAEVEARLREHFAARRPGLCTVYLYGSMARGDDHDQSDVDVAVLYETDPPNTLEGTPFSVESDLESLLGLPVQVIVLNHAPPDLVHRVLRDGILILDRIPAARIRFEVRSRNEYFDLLPVLKQYRRG